MQLKLQISEGNKAIMQQCLKCGRALSCRTRCQFFAFTFPGTGVFLATSSIFSLVGLMLRAYVSMMILVQSLFLPASAVFGAI